MNLLDRFTKDRIEHKVDMTFREIKNAKTPEEVVPLLIELSEFLDQENLTSQQLEEIKGLGTKAMRKHIQADFLNNIGALISIVTAGMIGGAALTILYYLFTLGVQSFIVFVLVPMAVLPIYLLYYGKTQKWFT